VDKGFGTHSVLCQNAVVRADRFGVLGPRLRTDDPFIAVLDEPVDPDRHRPLAVEHASRAQAARRSRSGQFYVAEYRIREVDGAE